MEICPFIRVNYDDRKEWLKDRGRGIGGSDAPVILGLSNWKTANQLWEEKTSYITISEEDNTNPSIVYGKTCEDAIRTLFTAKFVNKLNIIHTNDVLISKRKEYLRASLDGEIEVLEDFTFVSYNGEIVFLKKGMKGVLEIKTKYLPTKDDWKDSIPQNYYAQGVHYINVTEYDFIIYVVELRYINETASIRNFIFTKESMLEDIKYLEDEEDKFWDKVKKREQVPLSIAL